MSTMDSSNTTYLRTNAPGHRISRTPYDEPRPSSFDSDESLPSVEVTQINNQNSNMLMKLLRDTKRTASSSKNKVSDTTQAVKKLFGGRTRKLCSSCSQIPFDACLPNALPGTDHDTSNTEPLVFCMSLSEILDHREWCKFCRLLFRAICQDQYDLLRPDFIKNHVQDSQKLRKIETFAQWAEAFPKWRRLVGGEDIWPFGYTAATSEAAKDTLNRAQELFQVSEHKDINTKSLMTSIDRTYKDGDTAHIAGQTLDIGVGVLGLTNVGKSQEAQKVVAGIQLATSRLAHLTSAQRRRLPCLFVIRAYRKDETKAGVLSVRVYGHGRAALAPLQEITHFSLRFEGSDEPRASKEQIWYGRSLGRRIDIEFFKFCADACQNLHENCNKFPWTPIAHDIEKYRHFPFRLIDVHTMRIVEMDFEEAVKPDGYHVDYVALSYTWGTASINNGHSRAATLSHTRTNSSLNDRAQSTNSGGRRPTKLTSDNLSFLLHEGALDSQTVYVPSTIRDAINVTQRAGQSYLWVDSLCIIQEERHPDNEANIARMSRIYGEALFTIVAADSLHADAGLKGVSRSRDPYEQIIEPEMIKNARVFLPVSVQSSYDPWESRAWCFQEKLLSRKMLVFSGGFAVWHCGGGIWREDVNALDGDGGSSSFAWKKLVPVKAALTDLDAAGLQFSQEDESTRLFRSRAMDQYISTVEDFSGRDIGDSWRILDAFKGVQSLLESSNLLDSQLRYGLPSHYMDVALLWQPKGAVRRRKNKAEGNGTIIRYCPPSWSWAGWEAMDEGSKGAYVSYNQTYELEADSMGILRRLTRYGEERLRPLKGLLWGKVTNLPKVKQLGIFSLPGMDTKSFKGWESEPIRAKHPPPVLQKGQLSDRHLVLQTETAKLSLGATCYRVSTITNIGSVSYCREIFEDTMPATPGAPNITLSMERWIVDTETSKRLGLVKMNAGNKHTNSRCEEVEAVVLSESQYLGLEHRVDVLGYPVYNIMIVRRKTDVIVERIGLGKVYKYAWRKAAPRKEILVLE